MSEIKQLYEDLGSELTDLGKLAEVYRSELEFELDNTLNARWKKNRIDKIFVSPLSYYDGHPLEDYFFMITYAFEEDISVEDGKEKFRGEEAGIIFPIMRRAYCGLNSIGNQYEDFVFKAIEEVLSGRRYFVEYAPGSDAQSLIEKTRKFWEGYEDYKKSKKSEHIPFSNSIM